MSVVDEEYWEPAPHDLNDVFVVMEICISRKGLERLGYEAAHLSNDEMQACQRYPETVIKRSG